MWVCVEKTARLEHLEQQLSNNLALVNCSCYSYFLFTRAIIHQGNCMHLILQDHYLYAALSTCCSVRPYAGSPFFTWFLCGPTEFKWKLSLNPKALKTCPSLTDKWKQSNDPMGGRSQGYRGRTRPAKEYPNTKETQMKRFCEKRAHARRGGHNPISERQQ